MSLSRLFLFRLSLLQRGINLVELRACLLELFKSSVVGIASGLKELKLRLNNLFSLQDPLLEGLDKVRCLMKERILFG